MKMSIPWLGRGLRMPPAHATRIEPLPLAPRLHLLLLDDQGLPLPAVVEPGSVIREGQVLAEDPARGVALFAPAGGRLLPSIELALPTGGRGQTLVLETDPSAEPVEFSRDAKPLERSPEEIRQRLRQASLVQPGRPPRSLTWLIDEALGPHGCSATTPRALPGELSHLVVRLVDPEPELAALCSLALELERGPEDLELGTLALARACQARQVHLALERGAKLSGLESAAARHGWGLVRVRPGSYPRAHEALLAQAVSGREPDVARGGTQGVLVVDGDITLQVADAVARGRPPRDRPVSVVGPAGTRVFRCRLGTPLGFLSRAAGLELEAAHTAKIVLGGPLTGLAHTEPDFPVTAASAGLSVVPRAELTPEPNLPCVSCGLCVRVCPMRLVPGMLSRLAEFGQFEAARQAHLFTCIECGCCACVCPAGRSLVHFMAHAKHELSSPRSSSP
jgi:electron transport complex protein RnfC